MIVLILVASQAESFKLTYGLQICHTVALYIRWRYHLQTEKYTELLQKHPFWVAKPHSMHVLTPHICWFSQPYANKHYWEMALTLGNNFKGSSFLHHKVALGSFVHVLTSNLLSAQNIASF